MTDESPVPEPAPPRRDRHAARTTVVTAGIAIAAAWGGFRWGEVRSPQPLEDPGRHAARAELITPPDPPAAPAEEVAPPTRDLRVLEPLSTLQLPIDDDLRAPQWPLREARRLDAGYSRTFAVILGARTVGELTPTEVAAALGEFGAEHTAELAIAFDRWAAAADALSVDPAAASHLRDIATILDRGNSWRAHLRGLVPDATEGRSALVQLAAEMDLSELAPTSIALLGDMLCRANARREAIGLLRRGQDRHPADFGICCRLAVLLELADEPRWDEVAALYRVARALRPDAPEVLHRQGVALKKAGRLEAAERTFTELARRQPDDGQWRSHLAEVRMLRGDTAGALVAFRAALDLGFRSSGMLRQFAAALLAHGDRTGALANLREVVDLDPEDAEAHHLLGRTLAEDGEVEAAIPILRRALDLEPELAPACRALGEAFASRAQWEEAARWFEAAAQRTPDAPGLHRALGDALRAQGAHDDAARSYRRARLLDPDDVDLLDALGAVLLEDGRTAEAVEVMRKAVQLTPRDARRSCELGTLLLAIDEVAEAVDCLRVAVEAAPDNARAWLGLGTALGRLRRVREAATALERSLDLEPGDATALLRLAEVQEWMTGWESAIDSYRRAEAAWSNADDPDSVRSLEASIRRRRFLESQEALFTVARGEQRARSPTQWRDALRFSIDVHCFQTAVDLAERTLADDEYLARDSGGGLFDAARAAARLAAGEGAEPGTLTPGDRTRLRRLAHAWLETSIRAWIRRTHQGGAYAESARQRLRDAMADPAFAGVRSRRLEELPATDRGNWSALWAQIERAAGSR